MALSGISLKPKKEGGKGGLLGKIAGTVVGGVAGALTGNPLAGASLGGAIGGKIGSAADPAKMEGGRGVALSAKAGDPEVQLAKMIDAQRELLKSTQFSEPEKDEINATVFNPTVDALRKNIMRARGIG